MIDFSKNKNKGENSMATFVVTKVTSETYMIDEVETPKAAIEGFMAGKATAMGHTETVAAQPRPSSDVPPGMSGTPFGPPARPVNVTSPLTR